MNYDMSGWDAILTKLDRMTKEARHMKRVALKRAKRSKSLLRSLQGVKNNAP